MKDKTLLLWILCVLNLIGLIGAGLVINGMHSALTAAGITP